MKSTTPLQRRSKKNKIKLDEARLTATSKITPANEYLNASSDTLYYIMLQPNNGHSRQTKARGATIAQSCL